MYLPMVLEQILGKEADRALRTGDSGCAGRRPRGWNLNNHFRGQAATRASWKSRLRSHHSRKLLSGILVEPLLDPMQIVVGPDDLPFPLVVAHLDAQAQGAGSQEHDPGLG